MYMIITIRKVITVLETTETNSLNQCPLIYVSKSSSHTCITLR